MYKKKQIVTLTLRLGVKNVDFFSWWLILYMLGGQIIDFFFFSMVYI